MCPRHVQRAVADMPKLQWLAGMLADIGAREQPSPDCLASRQQDESGRCDAGQLT